MEKPLIYVATPEQLEGSPYITIAQRTLSYFGRYHMGEQISPDGIRFLDRQTLGVVDSALKTLVHNPQAARNLGRIDGQTAYAFDLYRRKNYAEEFPGPDDEEAFRRLMLAIGRVPEMARISGLPEGFYGSEELAPPFTAEEVFGRIFEVGRVTSGISRNDLELEGSIFENFPFLRTVWTFQGMGGISLREDEHIEPDLRDSLNMLKNRFAEESDR